MQSEPAELRRTATLRCPECGHEMIEKMPVNACIRRHECSACATLITPRPGDCCVFCSWGDVACPPVQLGQCC